MPQFFPAKSPAAPNREMPTIAMAGAIVSGVMKRRINPTTPQQLTVIEFFDLKCRVEWCIFVQFLKFQL